MSCGDSTRGLTHGGETAGGRVRRAPTAAAAGGNTPVSWWLGQNNKRTGELLGTLGQAGATRVGDASSRRVGFTMSADGQRQWRLGDAASREEGRWRPYIGELKAVKGLTCAPRRRKAVQVAAWVVGARRAWAPARVRRRGLRSGGAAGMRGERGKGEQGGVAQVGMATARGPAD
jgi:hypothetical protein